MKSFYTLLLSVLLVLCSALAAAEQEGTVRLTVVGLENGSGQLVVRVYNDAGKWLGDDYVLEKQVPLGAAVSDGAVTFELHLPRGEYAVTLFHDRNGDGKLKRYPMGMPAEPVVMSNNALGNFGPPKYVDAKFQVGAEPVEQTLDIS